MKFSISLGIISLKQINSYQIQYYYSILLPFTPQEASTIAVFFSQNKLLLMTSEITPLKIYREWFTALETSWATEIAKGVIKDVFITSSSFLTDDDTEAYFLMNSIDDCSSFLVNLIDRNIEQRNIDYERLLCQQLYSSTSYTLIKASQHENSVYKMLQENQMVNMVANNLERSAFYEESLKEHIENRSAAEDLKIKWDEFTNQYFNMALFIQREDS